MHPAALRSADICLGFDGFVLLPLSQQEWWYVARTLPSVSCKRQSSWRTKAFAPLSLAIGKIGDMPAGSRRSRPRYSHGIVSLCSIGHETGGAASTARWGVERLLMQGGEPQPVPQGVVESLVDSTDAEGIIDFHY